MTTATSQSFISPTGYWTVTVDAFWRWGIGGMWMFKEFPQLSCYRVPQQQRDSGILWCLGSGKAMTRKRAPAISAALLREIISHLLW